MFQYIANLLLNMPRADLWHWKAEVSHFLYVFSVSVALSSRCELSGPLVDSANSLVVGLFPFGGRRSSHADRPDSTHGKSRGD